MRRTRARPDHTEHRLILREAGDARTDFLYDTGDVVAEDQWKPRRTLQPEQALAVTAGALDVDRIHRRRFDAHEHLPRLGVGMSVRRTASRGRSAHAVQVSSLRMSWRSESVWCMTGFRLNESGTE